MLEEQEAHYRKLAKALKVENTSVRGELAGGQPREEKNSAGMASQPQKKNEPVPKFDNFTRERTENKENINANLNLRNLAECRQIQKSSATQVEYGVNKAARSNDEERTNAKRGNVEDMKTKYEAMNQHERAKLLEMLFNRETNPVLNIANLVQNPTHLNPKQHDLFDKTQVIHSSNFSNVSLSDSIIGAPQNRNPFTSKDLFEGEMPSTLKKSKASSFIRVDDYDEEQYEDDVEQYEGYDEQYEAEFEESQSNTYMDESKSFNERRGITDPSFEGKYYKGY